MDKNANKRKIIDFNTDDLVFPEQEEIEEDVWIRRLLENYNKKEDKESDEQAKNFDKAMGEFGNYIIMAERFNKIQPIYFDNGKIWWMWSHDKKCWLQIDEVDLMIMVDKAVNDAKTIHPREKSMIVEALKREGRKKKPKEFKKTWIQFKDKIIDIKTDEEMIPTPEYFTTNPIPWSLGLSEETPIIDNLFREWVGDKFKTTLYEIFAYCLLSDYPIHRAFCFIGSGSNGKSKCLLLLIRFIGNDNICSTEFELLLASRFEVAKLYRKSVCIMGETNFGSINRTSIFKRLTGQDAIGFEHKNKTPFDDYNYAKIIIATNSLPITLDKTEGFYRRWQIIEFPNKFTEEKDPLIGIPEEEFNNLAKRGVRVLKELLEKRKFTNEMGIEGRKAIYEEKSNYIQSFINEYCDIDDVNAELEFHQFYREFLAYCKSKSYRELSKKAVGQSLYQMGFERANRTKDGTSVNTIIGLKLKEDKVEYW